MNFLERIIGTIVNPNKTMEDIAKEPRWEETLVIVGIYAIIFAISTYLATTHIKYEYIGMEMPAGMETINLVSTLVMGFLMPIIFFIILCAVLFLISMALGGDGKFMTVLTALGYSAIPKIIFAIIGILVMTQAPYLTIEYDLSNPFGVLLSMGDYNKNIFVIASGLIVVVGLIWSCAIGVFAIKHTEKLSLKTAAIVVGVPALIYIAFTFGMKILGYF